MLFFSFFGWAYSGPCTSIAASIITYLPGFNELFSVSYSQELEIFSNSVNPPLSWSFLVWPPSFGLTHCLSLRSPYVANLAYPFYIFKQLYKKLIEYSPFCKILVVRLLLFERDKWNIVFVHPGEVVSRSKTRRDYVTRGYVPRNFLRENCGLNFEIDDASRNKT